MFVKLVFKFIFCFYTVSFSFDWDFYFKPVPRSKLSEDYIVSSIILAWTSTHVFFVKAISSFALNADYDFSIVYCILIAKSDSLSFNPLHICVALVLFFFKLPIFVFDIAFFYSDLFYPEELLRVAFIVENLNSWVFWSISYESTLSTRSSLPCDTDRFSFWLTSY